MEKILKHWTDALLRWLGAEPVEEGWDRWIALAIVVVIAVAFDYLCRVIVVHSIHPVVHRTKARWDDELFSAKVLNRLCHIFSALLLFGVLPILFEEKDPMRDVMMRTMASYVTVTVVRFVNTLLAAGFRIMAAHPAWLDKPIKGMRQTAQGIAVFVGAIVVVSILIDKSPAKLLTGLGASAAIILLIFRDSILGFVSGIQLSSNNMLKVGDWISVPKFGADGRVEEVSLNTVKIRNWDNTIVTLPPYMLVSDSFQNWRAMQLSGGRRVMRYVAIDMTSVCFCTPEMLSRYRQIDLVRDYIESTEQQIAAYNAAHGLDDAAGVNGRHLTNLGIFRAYLLNYLRDQVPINRDMTMMIRHLQPTEMGLPIELYFFTDTVDWVTYEGIQADVFDHVLAVIPAFDLRVFQSPTGHDLEAWQRSQSATTRKASTPPE